MKLLSGAFVATMALTSGESASAATNQVRVGKIGPGYGRMQPLDLGKPEKVAYPTPYYPHVTAPTVLRTRQPAPSAIVSPLPSPPMVIADVAQSRAPDIHRIY